LSVPDPIAQRPLGAVLDELGAKTPTPGGGAAAAIGAALGAALGRMVLNFTLGKRAYAEHEPENERRLDELADLQRGALDACERDERAFERFSALWALDEDDPVRAAGWDGALREAIASPRDLLDLCARVMDTLESCCGVTNRMLRSDIGVSAALIRGAAHGAAWNVRINLEQLEDDERAGAERDLRDALTRIDDACACITEACA